MGKRKMKFSTENPRYTAYTENAFGNTEAGTRNTKAGAWALAKAAARAAAADRPGIDHTASVYDRGANSGRGGMIHDLAFRA